MTLLQRTPEWFAAKLGKVGASRVSDVMARTKTGYGASRATYMAELLCERLTGVPTNGYVNAAMQWGLDTEPAAKAAYMFTTDRTIVDVGFVIHDRIGLAGASPDGLIADEDGLIEVKCPSTSTHIETLLTGKIEAKYLLQMQFQMACTGRAWCDYVSYDPRMPVEMHLWIKRVERDNVLIREIEEEVCSFLADLNAKLAALKSRYQEAA